MTADELQKALITSGGRSVGYAQERAILAKMIRDASPYNKGINAGLNSRNVNLGAVGNPLQITGGNRLEFFARCNQVMAEGNVWEAGEMFMICLLYTSTPAPGTQPAPAAPAPAATPASPAAPDASDAQYVDLEHWRPGPDASAPDTAAGNADDAKWEARYHALKGKYDAEVPRLSEEVRALKARGGQGEGIDTNAELQLLRDLAQRQGQELEALKQATPAAAPAAAPGLGELSDDDLAFEFGENGAKAIRALLIKVDGLQQQVADQVKPLETRLTQSEAQGFRERLALSLIHI